MIATRAPAAPVSRRSTVSVVAGLPQRVSGAAAAVAAVVVLAAPAQAGVVLQKPELKKLFQDDGAPAATSTSAPATGTKAVAAKLGQQAAAKAAPKPKAESSSSGGDIDPRSVALPGALVLIGAGAAAAFKLDPEFADFMTNASLKDSNTTGAGYEAAIKAEGGPALGGSKKVKASPAKKGTGFFGKK